MRVVRAFVVCCVAVLLIGCAKAKEMAEKYEIKPKLDSTTSSSQAETHASAVYPIGNVLSLDGDRDYMEIADQPDSGLDGMSAITIEALVFPVSLSSSPNAIVTKYDTSGSSQTSYSSWIRTNTLRVNFLSKPNSRLGGDIEVAKAHISQGKWFHLAGVWDGGTLHIYVNGVEQLYKQLRAGKLSMIGDTKTPVRIGTQETGRGLGNYFTGEIDEVRIWNIARTSEQIKANMQNTLTGSESGLVGYWNFDDGTVNDKSPKGNHGVLKGGAKTAGPNVP